jgi:predicted phage terminase large subunit-like protein
MNIQERLKQLYQQLAEGDMLALREKAKTRYADYVRYTHKYDKSFKTARFQEYICDCIDKLLNNELLNEDGKPYEGVTVSIPPQHGKSLCITETLPSYFLGRNPYKHVITIAYGEDLAVKFGRRNKQKIEEFGKDLFGIELSKFSSSALEFEIDKTNGGMISRGIGGAITGNPGDLILVDDPYKNRQEADSATYAEFVIDEWLNTIRTRASAKCKFIVVHTRWNEDDLIGYLLDTEPDKWFEIRFPLECEEPEEITGRKPGDALLPEAGKDNEWLKRFKISFINDPREGGIRAWNALMQQRPTSKEGNMVKREWWKRFTLTLEMQKPGFWPVKVQSWDCSFKDTDGTDPVAGHVWAKSGANYYLIDHKGGRMDIVKTMDNINEWNSKHHDAIAKLIEDKANGPAVIRIMRDKVSGLIPIKATKSKAERLNAVLPLWEAGNVYIPDKIEVSPGVFVKCEWAQQIIEQFAAFRPEKKVQRDDEVDAGSQALNWLYFRPANFPVKPKKDAFNWDKDDNEDSYFGGAPTEDYLNYGG